IQLAAREAEPAPAARAEAAPGTPASTALRLPEPLTPVVLHQLEALATHQASWQGQIWPGAQMQWSVVDPEGGQSGGGDEEIAVWQSRMRLQLPSLGEVDARLMLSAEGANIHLEAGAAASVERLREGLQSLRDAFGAAGITLTRITVREHVGT
ncbi:MAG: flagellar hook-length control protein FliK, partial [Candidatus Dactylopiibacterium sp.]|nr:flagellar hook-length control protein FliK [Candidatus Dactylopiibacterium sp.]